MPLVDPVSMGQNSSGQNLQQQWQERLMGKKIGENHDTTTFAKKDLPESHRILQPDSMSTMDFNPDRLNVHVGDDGTVRKVSHG